MLGGFTKGFLVPKQQAMIRKSFAITQNQWYDAFTGATEPASQCAAGAGAVQVNTRLIGFSFDQRTTGEDIEVRIIADDLDETFTVAAVAGTNYVAFMTNDPDNAYTVGFTATEAGTYRAYMLEARKLQIMYRKTSAAGVGVFLVKALIAKW